MHARELVELAASVATHVESILSGPTGISNEGLDAYWSISRQRLDRWTTVIDTSLEAAPTAGTIRDARSDSLLHLAEEVLASEVLTRVWAAVLSAATCLSAYHAAAATGRSVYLGHQEIRLRILKWMVEGSLAESPPVEALNLLRRRCERWTDLLLGRIALAADASAFAFYRKRLAEYHQDFQSEQRAGTLDTSWPTLLTSLASTLQSSLDQRPVCGEANAEIATAVLACLGSNSIDEWGTLRWAWLHRVERITTDAHRLIAELLDMEA